MPPWSPLGGEQRDIYGELAWIPNFQVTTSKDNTNLHRNYKEFFDKPKNYHLAASSSQAASSDFFKQNAPRGSVARPRHVGGESFGSSVGFINASGQRQSRDVLNGTSSTQNSAFLSYTGGSVFATPFVLVEDRDNKYKIDDRLKQTVQVKDSIPFLRTNDNDYKEVVYSTKQNQIRSSSFYSGSKQFRHAGSVALSPVRYIADRSRHIVVNEDQQVRVPDFKHRASNFLRRREGGWQQYVLPISKLNEGWHKSQKITFEKI